MEVVLEGHLHAISSSPNRELPLDITALFVTALSCNGLVCDNLNAVRDKYLNIWNMF